VLIVVGLGNPGPKYQGTRHNVGFSCVDLLAERWGLRLSDRRAKAVLAQGFRGGQQVVLAKPRTFMNNSGEGVEYLLARFGARPADLLLIYDDMELPSGKLRIRASGSGGTHNGIRSIIAALQTQEIPRLRIGIGHPPPGQETIPFVLARFEADEKRAIAESVSDAADAVDCLLAENIDEAMNRFN
jgi:PTH1 family peptidyl-tRNA hydrolase